MEGKDFVFFSTSPLVGVVESPKVATLMQKNNLSCFVDLIRPFGERLGGIATQDAMGNAVQIDPCFLRFCDINKLDSISQDQFIQTMMSKVMPDYGLDNGLPALKNKAEVQKYREKGIVSLRSCF
jgi:hypothetical protein